MQFVQLMLDDVCECRNVSNPIEFMTAFVRGFREVFA